MKEDRIKEIIYNLINKNDKTKYIIFVMLICGIFLILCSSLFNSSEKTEEKKESLMSASEYKDEIENSIEDALCEVKGVGNVSVTVTLDGEMEKSIAYNETNSSSSSGKEGDSSDSSNSSKDAVMVRDGYGETPFLTKDSYPEVVGVVVVADGADNKTVEYYITKSVEALLDLPSYKVVVLPSKNK